MTYFDIILRSDVFHYLHESLPCRAQLATGGCLGFTAAQVSAVASSTFVQLRLVHLSQSDLATMASQLDYCNTLYVGLPLKTFRKL